MRRMLQSYGGVDIVVGGGYAFFSSFLTLFSHNDDRILILVWFIEMAVRRMVMMAMGMRISRNIHMPTHKREKKNSSNEAPKCDGDKRQ